MEMFSTVVNDSISRFFQIIEISKEKSIWVFDIKCCQTKLIS